jgi:hypothetical protein
VQFNQLFLESHRKLFASRFLQSPLCVRCAASLDSPNRLYSTRPQSVGSNNSDLNDQMTRTRSKMWAQRSCLRKNEQA